MKIVEHTHDRLVLVQRPWLFWGAVHAAALGCLGAGLFAEGFEAAWQRAVTLGLGLALLWIGWRFIPFTTTVFARAEGIVTQQERRITGRRHRAIRLDTLEGAQVEAIRTDEGGRQTRLSLRDASGRLWPLELSYGSGDRRALETAIDDWLTRSAAAPPT